MVGGGIPKQSILEAIEQFLLEPMEFQHLDIDQVQLIIKSISLKPEQQIKGDKKVCTIHVVVSEDKKTQARQSLKTIYPSIPRQHYPEGI